ncbi:MAG: phage tail protein, partial [Pseudomonadota bacterium]
MALISTAASAAILTATGSTFLAFAGQVAISTVVSLGLSKLSQAIAGTGKPASQRGERFGVSRQLQIGGEVPRSFIPGRGATAGSLVYSNTWAPEANAVPNNLLTLVIALSDLPCGALVDVWVNGEKVTLLTGEATGRGSPVSQFRTAEGYKNDTPQDHLWIKYYDGTQTEADDFLRNQVASEDRPWGSNRRGIGVAYAIVTAKLHQTVMRDVPQLLFELNGTPLYDPTKDDTAGGSGPQRYGDRSTWGTITGNMNPAVIAYNLLRGISYRGDHFYGLQSVHASRLPDADWIAAIQACRADVDEADGRQRFADCGAEVFVNQPLRNALEGIETACAGRISYSGGRYRMQIGAFGAPVAKISDDDILVEPGQTYEPFPRRAETVNGIAARHPDPDQSWAMREMPTIIWDGLVERDGGRQRLADVALDWVFRREQAQRMAVGALKEAQRARRHVITLPPEFMGLEPGDVILWRSVRHFYDGKRFVIDAATVMPYGNIILQLRETNRNDYDWDTASEYRPPANAPIGRVKPPVQQVGGFIAAPEAVSDGANARRPGLRLTWDAAESDVEAIRVQVRRAGETALTTTARLDDVEEGSALITDGILPNEDYEVRTTFVTEGQRETEWTSWTAVTAPTAEL